VKIILRQALVKIYFISNRADVINPSIMIRLDRFVSPNIATIHRSTRLNAEALTRFTGLAVTDGGFLSDKKNYFTLLYIINV